MAALYIESAEVAVHSTEGRPAAIGLSNLFLRLNGGAGGGGRPSVERSRMSNDTILPGCDVSRARKEWLEWFRVDIDIEHHPKTAELAHALGDVPVQQAIGEIVLLWAWIARFAPSGRIDESGVRALRMAGVRIDALVQSGFLSASDSALIAPNWGPRNGYPMRHRERNRTQNGRKSDSPRAGTEQNSTEQNLESESKTCVPTERADAPIPSQENVQSTKALLRTAANGLSLTKPPIDPQPFKDAVWDVLMATPGLDSGTMTEGLRLAATLFKDGTAKDTGLLCDVIRDWLSKRHRIRNAYAYYASGGEGFEWLLSRISRKTADAEHAKIRAEEAEFFK